MARRGTRSTAAGTGSPFLRHISLAADADLAKHPFDIPAFSKGIDLALSARVTFFVGE